MHFNFRKVVQDRICFALKPGEVQILHLLGIVAHLLPQESEIGRGSRQSFASFGGVFEKLATGKASTGRPDDRFIQTRTAKHTSAGCSRRPSCWLGLSRRSAKGTAQAPGQASTQGTQPAFFNSLLERGKKRPLSATVQSGNFEDVPSLQLGLDDIRRKARELGTPGTKDSLQNGTATKA